jgi:squalene-hopene/tetraprenyl-beta-curcumene cyclase
VERVTDGKGQTHDWRAEITAALRARQRDDGSWVNKSPAWMEANPHLATSWALDALSHCKPQAK